MTINLITRGIRRNLLMACLLRVQALKTINLQVGNTTGLLMRFIFTQACLVHYLQCVVHEHRGLSRESSVARRQKQVSSREPWRHQQATFTKQREILSHAYFTWRFCQYEKHWPCCFKVFRAEKQEKQEIHNCAARQQSCNIVTVVCLLLQACIVKTKTYLLMNTRPLNRQYAPISD